MMMHKVNKSVYQLVIIIMSEVLQGNSQLFILEIHAQPQSDR